MALPSIFTDEEDPTPPVAEPSSTATAAGGRRQFREEKTRSFKQLRRRFREEGLFGIDALAGEEANLRPKEKQVLEGANEETGYLPKTVAPQQSGDAMDAAAEYVTRETADRTSRIGSILMSPIGESAGEAAEYNSRSRSGGRPLAEEVAHDVTLADREAARDSARAVARRNNADPDSLASLMRVSFEEDYEERPHEKVASSLAPAIMNIAGVEGEREVSDLNMDLARSLLEGAADRRGTDQQQAQSRFFGDFLQKEIGEGADPAASALQ